MRNHTTHTDEFSRIAVSDRKKGLDLLVKDTRRVGLSADDLALLEHFKRDGDPRRVAFAQRQIASASAYAGSAAAPAHRATGSRFAPQ